MGKFSFTTPAGLLAGALWAAAQGDFFAMTRVAVLLDGFNLYHSIKDLGAEGQDEGFSVRWLDLKSLSHSFLHQIEGGNEKDVSAIHYFSAYADHKVVEGDPEHVVRHRKYIRVLKNLMWRSLRSYCK